MEQATERALTFGEKAVGLSFNPSKDSRVDSIKRKYAAIIDELDEIRNSPATISPEIKRQLSVAITEAQTSQMWAVKAVTWQY